MSENVYNIIWADDEIDDLLDEVTERELLSKGFKIVGRAHDGEELQKCISSPNAFDAVIVDANFNESSTPITSERDTSGLDYARSLYIHTLARKKPFFLFTNRSDELLNEIYQHNPKFLEDFPRHVRWFNKSGRGEYDDMLVKIKQAVDEMKSTSFTVRNRFSYELNACGPIDGAYEFVFDYLIRDMEGTLHEMIEPFVSVRKIIEKIFGACDTFGIIPPISNDTNGTAAYFNFGKYGKEKDAEGKRIIIYETVDEGFMPLPLARALSYIVDITQDGAHSKKDLKLRVDEYFSDTKDTLLLRSVVSILIDLIKWFTVTAINCQDNFGENIAWRKL